MTIDLASLLKEQKDELKELSAALVGSNREKIIASLGTLVLAMASGHPELSVLAPFLHEGVRRAFASTAARRLQNAVLEAENEDARAALARRVATPLEALIDQAILQIIRVQNRTNEEVTEALGDLRDDFGAFREEVRKRLNDRSDGGTRGAVPRSTLLNLGRCVGRHDDFAAIRLAFADAGRGARLVLAGEPGVGKSHLANAFGVLAHDRYPGGTFFIPFNVDPALRLAALRAPLAGESIAERAHRALSSIVEPTFLVFDNVSSERDLAEWLPSPTLPVHLLVTTTNREWSSNHAVRVVGRLSDDDARALIASVTTDERVTLDYGANIIRRAAGVAVQIKSDATLIDYELRHHRTPHLSQALAEDSISSFERTFRVLTGDSQFAARVMALFNEAQIPTETVVTYLTSEGWDSLRIQRAVDGAVDRTLVSHVGQELRMHSLVADFLRQRAEPPLPTYLLNQHYDAFIAAARAFVGAPGDAKLRAQVGVFPGRVIFWQPMSQRSGASDLHTVGKALINMGRFADANEWLKNSAEIIEGGDTHGRIDHESLGRSLHDVGFSLCSAGKLKQGLSSLTRAVDAKKKGDVDGRVNNDSLGQSLHEVGFWLSSAGQFEEALPWLQSALVAKQDVGAERRVDHDNVAASLHQIGYCLSGAGNHSEALGWFRRAVAAREKGGADGKVDHEGLGRGMHQVGYCLFEAEKFDEALPWFQQAAEAAEKGDVHGRIDQESLGASLLQIGVCSARAGKFEEALPWFQRAVAAAEKGNVFGKVNHENLGKSLFLVGCCMSSAGKLEVALTWFLRAVDAVELGDVYGQVDRAIVAEFATHVRDTFRDLGRHEDAALWESRAIFRDS